jgi:hypothetical protein
MSATTLPPCHHDSIFPLFPQLVHGYPSLFFLMAVLSGVVSGWFSLPWADHINIVTTFQKVRAVGVLGYLMFKAALSMHVMFGLSARDSTSPAAGVIAGTMLGLAGRALLAQTSGRLAYFASCPSSPTGPHSHAGAMEDGRRYQKAN